MDNGRGGLIIIAVVEVQIELEMGMTAEQDGVFMILQNRFQRNGRRTTVL